MTHNAQRSLFEAAVRLAHANPTLRPQLLPLLRVAASSPLAQELEQRVEQLVEKWDRVIARDSSRLGVGDDFAKWFTTTFRVELPATPRGGKNVKELAQRFLWMARYGLQNTADTSLLKQDWAAFRPHVDDLVNLFSDAGGSTMLREIRTSIATYRNLKGLSTGAFQKYVQSLDATFGALTGWRRKALSNGLTVALAGPDVFRGTAAGKYNIQGDILFIRATPAVMKRSGNQYASPEYIIIHELGHRYEKLYGAPNVPFTTPYSRSEGAFGQSEAFAEMFALGHFGIRSYRDLQFGDVIDRFEASR